MSGIVPKPPYEPEFAAFLGAMPGPKDFDAEMIPALRAGIDATATLESALGDLPFDHEERTIPGPHGPVVLSIFRPKELPVGRSGRPGIFYTHSGGMVCGNRFMGLNETLRWSNEASAVCVSVEYRLSPMHRFPVPLDDCYVGLTWVWEHVAELGIDPEYLILSGQSAGGNLAAALSMLARDQNGPKIRAQLLDSPMLDDRRVSNSGVQFVSEGTWSQATNVTAWEAYLGSVAGKADVNPLAAPVRIRNAEGLPPTFICAGSAELFRDESIEYAQKLWAAGVQVELHIWPGGFHLFDMLLPDHPVSKLSTGTKAAWVRKVLAKPVQGKL